MVDRTGIMASEGNTERRKEEEEKSTDDRVGTCWRIRRGRTEDRSENRDMAGTELSAG